MKDAKKLTKRMLELQKLLNKFSEIERHIYVKEKRSSNRRENDTEHSYSLAMMAWFLSSQYDHLDRDKIIRYALVHDLVEVHAGDVMALGRTKQQEKEKQANEKAALQQLRSDWPDFSEVTDLIEDYENQQSPEAMFVKALDKIMPIHHQLITKGKTWKKYDTDRKTVLDLKDITTKRSEEVHALWKEFRQHILDHDEYFNKGKAN